MPTSSVAVMSDEPVYRSWLDAASYDQLAQRFDWSVVDRELGWQDSGSIDLGRTIVDRNVGRPNPALVWVDRDGEPSEVSYLQLSHDSARCARVLRRLGIRKGDRVAALMPRVPETIALLIACLKLGAVYVPIFTGFSIDGIRYRVRHSGAKLLCTIDEQVSSLAGFEDCPVLMMRGNAEGTLSYEDEARGELADFENVAVQRDDIAVIMYTSGSTGMPKGGLLAANLVAAVWPYLRSAVALREGDRYWPTGDPGWGYGLICYLSALAAGGTVVMSRRNLRAADALAMMKKVGVTNLASTPTLLRDIIALGDDAVAQAGCFVHTITSCGEPLNSEVVEFFRRVWRVDPLDQFGATEFGVLISNYAAMMEVKQGSMGRCALGHEIALLDEQGVPVAHGSPGYVAKRQGGGALYFLGYWNDPEATAQTIADGWIRTGDIARLDDEGYYWFQGRSGDMIKSSGYRLGPFEIESAILRHPLVAEAGVIGKPDPLRGEAIKAFVVLKPGHTAATGLADEIVALIKATLGRHQAPHEIEFVEDLPKTSTGKIQRFALRERP